MRQNSHIMYRLTLALVLTVTAPIVVSQENSSQPVATASARDQKPGSDFKERQPRYRLVAGDTFELTFEFSDEFNQVVIVQPDGYITLREVGDLYVAGKTVPELTSALLAAYQRILYKPVLAVVLKDFEKPYFIAGGQVAHPGKYTLRGDTTLTEAIAMAGGFTEKSKHSQVLLFRHVSSQWTEARVLDVKKMLNARNLSEDPYLRPGDMVFVPQNRFSKIEHFIPTANMGAYVSPTQF